MSFLIKALLGVIVSNLASAGVAVYMRWRLQGTRAALAAASIEKTALMRDYLDALVQLAQARARVDGSVHVYDQALAAVADQALEMGKRDPRAAADYLHGVLQSAAATVAAIAGGVPAVPGGDAATAAARGPGPGGH